MSETRPDCIESIRIGDTVEVWNPGFTGARGTVIGSAGKPLADMGSTFIGCFHPDSTERAVRVALAAALTGKDEQ